MQLSPLEYILIVSTILEASPFFQVVKSIQSKSVKGISPFTFLGITVVAFLWLIYSISIASIPLIIGNTIKLFANISVVVIYLLYKDTREVLDKLEQ